MGTLKKLKVGFYFVHFELLGGSTPLPQGGVLRRRASSPRRTASKPERWRRLVDVAGPLRAVLEQDGEVADGGESGHLEHEIDVVPDLGDCRGIADRSIIVQR